MEEKVGNGQREEWEKVNGLEVAIMQNHYFDYDRRVAG